MLAAAAAVARPKKGAVVGGGGGAASLVSQRSAPSVLRRATLSTSCGPPLQPPAGGVTEPHPASRRRGSCCGEGHCSSEERVKLCCVWRRRARWCRFQFHFVSLLDSILILPHALRACSKFHFVSTLDSILILHLTRCDGENGRTEGGWVGGAQATGEVWRDRPSDERGPPVRTDEKVGRNGPCFNIR
jgi:hypothetical protein